MIQAYICFSSQGTEFENSKLFKLNRILSPPVCLGCHLIVNRLSKPIWLHDSDFVDDGVHFEAQALDLPIPRVQDIPGAKVDNGVDLVDVAMHSAFTYHF